MTNATEKAARAGAFETVAETYAEVRPRYPDELFDDLYELADLNDESRAVEIGAGPGVATAPLGRRGLHIVALEPGPSLSTLARRAVADFPHVEVRTTTFEEAVLPPSSFDLLYSASAWHWVDHDRGPDLAADVLKPGGRIALWGAGASEATREGDEFTRASKAVHDRWLPIDFDPHPMKGNVSNVLDSPRFGNFRDRHYEFSLTYDTATYLRLLDTYSSYRLLEPELRASLFADLATTVDGQFGGQVIKPFMATLLVGDRLN
jgi:SAM-dependent methyltransferase